LFGIPVQERGKKSRYQGSIVRIRFRPPCESREGLAFQFSCSPRGSGRRYAAAAKNSTVRTMSGGSHRQTPVSAAGGAVRGRYMYPVKNHAGGSVSLHHFLLQPGRPPGGRTGPGRLRHPDHEPAFCKRIPFAGM